MSLTYKEQQQGQGLFLQYNPMTRDQPIMLNFYLLCYAAELKILLHYAQYYAHAKKLYLKFDCFIRVYSLV